MDPLGAKITTTVVLAVGTALSGLSPLRLARSTATDSARHRQTLNALLSFSGGVLFATCFVHLLPDVHDEFESVLPPLPTPESRRIMPWGELAVCLGFFLIYGVEEVVEYFVCRAGCEEKHHHHRDQVDTKTAATAPPQPEGANDDQHTLALPNKPSSVSYQNLDGMDEKERGSCMSPVHRIHGTHRKPHRQKHCKKTAEKISEKPPLTIIEVDSRLTAYQQLVDDDDADDERQSLMSSDDDCSEYLLTPSHNDHSQQQQHHHHKEEPDSRPRSAASSNPARTVQTTLRGVMLVLALSFHSVFEGLAIGLQDTASGVWTSFLAVVLHKLVMAFCVGVELLQLRTPRGQFVAHVLVFALVAPIGIALGTIITETRWSTSETIQKTESVTSGPIVLASLQGLACGTLLYVTFFEVLTRTRGNELKSLINFAAVLLGFALMVALHVID